MTNVPPALLGLVNSMVPSTAPPPIVQLEEKNVIGGGA